MQWRLSNGYAVNKNQQGIAYRIVGGSGKETSIHSSQGDECRSSKRGTMYQVQILARPNHSNGACVQKMWQKERNQEHIPLQSEATST